LQGISLNPAISPDVEGQPGEPCIAERLPPTALLSVETCFRSLELGACVVGWRNFCAAACCEICASLTAEGLQDGSEPTEPWGRRPGREVMGGVVCSEGMEAMRCGSGEAIPLANLAE